MTCGQEDIEVLMLEDVRRTAIRSLVSLIGGTPSEVPLHVSFF